MAGGTDNRVGYHRAMPPAAFTLTVDPSRRLVLAAAAAHLLAVAAVLLAELPWPYRAVLLAAVAVSLARSARRTAPVGLRCQPDGQLAIGAGDDWEAVELLPDTMVLSWLVVLRYRCAGRPRSLVVLAGAVADEDFRRLRVWLRWRAARLGKDAHAPS